MSLAVMYANQIAFVIFPTGLSVLFTSLNYQNIQLSLQFLLVPFHKFWMLGRDNKFKCYYNLLGNKPSTRKKTAGKEQNLAAKAVSVKKIPKYWVIIDQPYRESKERQSGVLYVLIWADLVWDCTNSATKSKKFQNVPLIH